MNPNTDIQQQIDRLMTQAAIHQDDFDLDQAEALLIQAIGLLRHSSAAPRKQAIALAALADLCFFADRRAEARRLWTEALALDAADPGPPDAGLAATLSALVAEFQTGADRTDGDASVLPRPDLAAALELARAAAANAVAAGPQAAAEARVILARCLHDAGQTQAAAPLARASLDELLGLLPPDHPAVASAQLDLAVILRDTDAAPHAAPLALEALRTIRTHYGDGSWYTRGVAGLVLDLLRATAPDHPSLPGLRAIFGSE